MRVVVLVAVFVVQRDWVFEVITGVVLGLLVAGFVVGGSGG